MREDRLGVIAVTFALVLGCGGEPPGPPPPDSGIDAPACAPVGVICSAERPCCSPSAKCVTLDGEAVMTCQP